MNYSSLYNLACALAVAGEADSSLYCLYRLMELNPTDYPLADPDFISLRNDKRWLIYQNDLIATIQTKYNNAIADEEYARKLWEMGARDQMYYREITIIERKKGASDTELHRLWKMKEQINLENQRQLEQLVRKKGWPKATIVGSRAASAAFLVIQHADLKMQQKYLPVIKSLCEEGEAEWQAYALMYDRVQITLKKPQRYGSQVHYNDETHRYELFPLEDETRVDYWRKQAGMRTLAEYLSHWDIQWPEKK